MCFFFFFNSCARCKHWLLFTRCKQNTIAAAAASHASRQKKSRRAPLGPDLCLFANSSMCRVCTQIHARRSLSQKLKNKQIQVARAHTHNSFSLALGLLEPARVERHAAGAAGREALKRLPRRFAQRVAEPLDVVLGLVVVFFGGRGLCARMRGRLLITHIMRARQQKNTPRVGGQRPSLALCALVLEVPLLFSVRNTHTNRSDGAAKKHPLLLTRLVAGPSRSPKIFSASNMTPPLVGTPALHLTPAGRPRFLPDVDGVLVGVFFGGGVAAGDAVAELRALARMMCVCVVVVVYYKAIQSARAPLLLRVGVCVVLGGNVF